MKDKSNKAPFYGMIEQVCVLLVDHDKEFATETIDLLESNGYKVITVMVHGAMSMLSKEKEKIDVMIINVNSPNSLCFKLLQQAVALNIISIVVCAEYDKLLAMNAMYNGAYLCMKTPLCDEIVKNLWQFILREENRREKAGKGLETNEDQINVDDISDNNIVEDEESKEKNMHINTDERRGKRGRKSTEKINEEESQRSTINKTTRQKDCTQWTEDKFAKAIDQRGEKRCYPSNTLEVMNMPSLIKDQISSQLQKCHNNNWRSANERTYIRQGSSSGSEQTSSYIKSSERKNRTSCMKFGTMPSIQTNLSNQTQKSLELPPVNTNFIFDGSTQQQPYHPQFQAQPHYLNPFMMAQNDVGGGPQQQHDQLFGGLGSKSSIIESTNYRPGLDINGGNHHPQLQVQPHYLNSFMMAQNDVGGGPQQQDQLFSGLGSKSPIIESTNYGPGLDINGGNYHNYGLDHHTQNNVGTGLQQQQQGLLFGMSGSKSPIIESTNYRSGLAFNSGDRHNYGLDLNASHVLTYSGVENMRTNELGAANANYQQYIGEQNVFHSSNIATTTNMNNIDGSNPNEWDMDDFFQIPKSPSATLPNQHGNGSEINYPISENRKYW